MLWHCDRVNDRVNNRVGVTKVQTLRRGGVVLVASFPSRKSGLFFAGSLKVVKCFLSILKRISWFP
jgi:hypothetical protein